jgi:hypothetical protein
VEESSLASDFSVQFRAMAVTGMGALRLLSLRRRMRCRPVPIAVDRDWRASG